MFFFFKQKTAYEMRISDWSSDVCSSDLVGVATRIGSGPAPSVAAVRIANSVPHVGKSIIDRRQRLFPVRENAGQVVGMERIGPTRAERILGRRAGKLGPARSHFDDLAFGIADPWNLGIELDGKDRKSTSLNSRH